MKREHKRDLTKEEWELFAQKLKSSLAGLRENYFLLLKTATIKEADVMARVIRRVQVAWSEAEEICFSQHGDEFSMKIFHGEGWVFF